MALRKFWNAAKQVFFDASGVGCLPDETWKLDAGLREAMRDFQGEDCAGDTFFSDLKEFLEGLDAYNAKRDSRERVTLVFKERCDGDLVAALTSPRTMFGITDIGSLGLARNGRVFHGEYFNDLIFNSGFSFCTPFAQAKFLCGLPRKADFEKFASDLFRRPTFYHGPYLWR